ncbi:CobW family GTP-binding protein [Orrella dioscoreae]|uniref:Metal chaperone, involved in Zn homeostasis, GTPase of COG0523 family n=1 Tax=Orrella dioscoreae TaxID=1851544 RepID=A0A1C3K7Y0_9BURK|nr:CobW family GTP-binding protein [Orrella dioscoreae]SBT27629.1 Putative metal chaperone, involved in Zn homeostasis, GTPase of COG0523 family [Orrella dioscoreae]SOE48647.1 Putative metal chaperone, involved in Zn homeostasis, GTPase of COG0523 family [Orrella dioscoreae]
MSQAGGGPAPADRRIPLVVVTGFLGSGKTTLVNRLLREPGLRETAVVVNELGSIAVDHHLLRVSEGGVALLEGGCVCCSLRGELSETLRDLFMQALQRRIPAFSRVLLETTGMADPAAVLFTLRHDPFLVERYAYAGTVMTLDAVHGAGQLSAQPEASRQLAQADLAVLTKTDLATPAQRAETMAAMARHHPGLRAVTADTVQSWRGTLDALGPYRQAGPGSGWQGWLGLSGVRAVAPASHAGVRVISLPVPGALHAGRFLAGLAALQDAHGEAILRIKGLLRFSGQAVTQVLHGVHKQRYPLAPVPSEKAGKALGLVLIVRGSPAESRAIEARAEALLRECATPD